MPRATIASDTQRTKEPVRSSHPDQCQKDAAMKSLASIILALALPVSERRHPRLARPGFTPQHVVERKDGKTGGHRALRARAGSRRGRRGHPVLQEPVLGAADSERRNCPGIRGVLSEVPEASMSAAAAMRRSTKATYSL